MVTYSNAQAGYTLQASPHQVTVCEILADLQKYRGQFIEVRGEFNGVLRGECPKTKFNDWTWPNEIYVTASWDPLMVIDRKMPVDWTLSFGREFYLAALNGAWKDWAALPRSQRKKNTVMATISGRLDTREKEFLFRDGFPNGYGAQNVYPAQLVILDFKDLAVGPAQNGPHPPPKRKD